MENGDSDNVGLLSAFSSFLTSSQDTGRPIASDLVAELVNGKFNVEYCVEKRKEFSRNIRSQVIVTMCLFPK